MHAPVPREIECFTSWCAFVVWLLTDSTECLRSVQVLQYISVGSKRARRCSKRDAVAHVTDHHMLYVRHHWQSPTPHAQERQQQYHRNAKAPPLAAAILAPAPTTTPINRQQRQTATVTATSPVSASKQEPNIYVQRRIECCSRPHPASRGRSDPPEG